jgi:hypothetical protein
LLLLRRQVLPGLHALQNSLLSFRRKAIEALQPLVKLLLPVRRKATKIPVVLEGLALLLQGLIAMLIQPLTGMMTFGGWLILPGRALRFVTRLGTRLGSLRAARTWRFRTRLRPGLSGVFLPAWTRGIVSLVLGPMVLGE